MRLLNVHTLEFRTFLGDDVPNYSIASHRWVSDECSIKDIIKRRNLDSNGYKKVAGFCAYVKQANELYKDTHPELVCEYLWIDTCCIDQKSSLEVDTAIRSMFQWYNKSVICYAYLADVEPLSVGNERLEASFRDSVWFSRGWTLQELLAPRTVVFLTRKWEVIGHKCTNPAITDGGQCPGVGHRLNGMISEITGIPELVLYDYPESKKLSIEERMSWSAKRQTTRQEDGVYCLLGIFEIHMPVMYGEGDGARERLQEMIKKKTELGDKGQKAGNKARYNERAPCAVVHTTSHLPTVSQVAKGALPEPVAPESNNEPAGRAAPDESIIGSQKTSTGPNTSPPSASADDLAEGLSDLNVKKSPGLARASTTGSGQAFDDDDEEMFKPPNRAMTFNMLREPYARNNSGGQGVSSSTWDPVQEEPEEDESFQPSGQAKRAVQPPPPPPARQPVPRPPIPGSQPHSSQATVSPPPAAKASAPQDHAPSTLPPPPDYDSIWSEAPQRPPEKGASAQAPRSTPPYTSSAPAPQSVPSYAASNAGSNDSYNTAPSRTATWANGVSDMPPPSRNATWSTSAQDYDMPPRDEMRSPTRTATSTFGDANVPLSSRAQRKLEHTIAREERKEGRREKRRERRAKRSGDNSTVGTAEDMGDSDEDMISNAGSSFSHGTDQRSYSSGAGSSNPAQQNANSRMYDVAQDARRQDARRRFFAQGNAPEPARSPTIPMDTDAPPPPPTRTKTNSSSLSDLADSLPSGLRLTKTALRMLDTRTSDSGSPPAADDQQTVAPSEATTRTKPLGYRELKQVLRDQKNGNRSGQDENGRKMSPRERLMSAVSGHLRNS